MGNLSENAVSKLKLISQVREVFYEIPVQEIEELKRYAKQMKVEEVKSEEEKANQAQE